MSSLQETIDLEALKARIRGKKIECFDFCIHIFGLPDDQLKFTGFKSKEQAAVKSVTEAKQKIDAWTKEYVRKYPDAR